MTCGYYGQFDFSIALFRIGMPYTELFLFKLKFTLGVQETIKEHIVPFWLTVVFVT